MAKYSKKLNSKKRYISRKRKSNNKRKTNRENVLKEDILEEIKAVDL